MDRTEFRRRNVLFVLHVLFFISIYPGMASSATQTIAAGSTHTLLINADGTLFAWGRNDFGQLGNGTTSDSIVPVQIGAESDWIAVAPGGRHTIALKANGTLWAWGSNEYSQLGDTAIVDTSLVPVQIGTDNNWASIAAGAEQSVALKNDGTLWAWGNYSYQMVGNYRVAINSATPIQVGTDADWVFINASSLRTFAIKSNGSLWGWGWVEYGIPTYHGSDYHPEPFQVGSDSDWLSISAGGSHQLAMKRDGSLWAWGDNTYGQVGDGSTTHSYLPKKIGYDLWRSVSAGGATNYGIRSDGTLWAWGGNQNGELGIGTANSGAGSLVPIQVGSQNDWVLAAGGGNHFVSALKADSSIWGWGWNYRGQVGYGHALNILSPVQLSLHPVDADGDAWYSFEDCNDEVSAIHPGVPEIKYDGIDQDCNGYDLTITVTKALTSIVRKAVNMHVEATSSLGADANLYYSLSPDMPLYFTWDSRRQIWVLDTNVVSTDTIIVCGVEGCDYPAPVTVRMK